MLSALKILAVAALWYIKSSSLPKFCLLKFSASHAVVCNDASILYFLLFSIIMDIVSLFYPIQFLIFSFQNSRNLSLFTPFTMLLLTMYLVFLLNLVQSLILSSKTVHRGVGRLSIADILQPKCCFR